MTKLQSILFYSAFLSVDTIFRHTSYVSNAKQIIINQQLQSIHTMWYNNKVVSMTMYDLYI